MKRDIINIIQVFNNNADLYQERYMDVSHYSTSLNLLADSLPKNAKLLDVACGPANISSYLLTKRKDLNITGTDLADNMLALARKNIAGGTFLKKDCRDFTWIDEQFDAIIFGFCFPYVNKLEAIRMISEAKKHLSLGGLLCISTMEDKYENSSFKAPSSGNSNPIFMHYHEAGYLKDALTQSGYTIMHQKRVNIENEEVLKDLVLIGNL